MLNTHTHTVHCMSLYAKHTHSAYHCIPNTLLVYVRMLPFSHPLDTTAQYHYKPNEQTGVPTLRPNTWMYRHPPIFPLPSQNYLNITREAWLALGNNSIYGLKCTVHQNFSDLRQFQSFANTLYCSHTQCWEETAFLLQWKYSEIVWMWFPFWNFIVDNSGILKVWPPHPHPPLTFGGRV